MIKLENVTFGYGKKPILQNFNLSIAEGEFVAVLGHNGSGKSTLAKLLNGILLPSEGRVLSAGFDTQDEATLFELRKNVGMVFQNPDNQIVATIVEEDVAFGLENMGVEPEIIRARVAEALRTVEMYEFRRHAPYLLSGGQKQRVAIAGIIAMQPRCIVLDEPTAMLDPRGRDEVMRTINSLRRDMGITIVLITHYMNEAAMADRLIVMNEGAILEDASPRTVFPQVDLMRSVGLDVPQVTLLAHILKKNGVDIRTDILHASECTNELLRLLGGAS